MKIYFLVYYVLLIDFYSNNVDVGHVNYLSPEKAEDQFMGTLQNHKDDEFIYTFGIQGQDNPSLVENYTIQFSNFHLLCKVFNIMSKYSNKENNEFQQNPIEQNEEENEFEQSDDITEFKEMYEFFQIVLLDEHDLHEEIKTVYDNLPRIQLSTETLLEILDMKEYYENLIKNLDQKSADFVKLKREIDLIVHEFQSSMKKLLNSVELFREFEILLLVILTPFKKQFLENEPKNIFYKVDRGIDMLQQIFNIKQRAEFQIKDIETGITQFYSVRPNIKFLLQRFNEFPQINIENNISIVQYINIIMLVIFIWFQQIHFLSIQIFFFIFQQLKLMNKNLIIFTFFIMNSFCLLDEEIEVLRRIEQFGIQIDNTEQKISKQNQFIIQLENSTQNPQQFLKNIPSLIYQFIDIWVNHYDILNEDRIQLKYSCIKDRIVLIMFKTMVMFQNMTNLNFKNISLTLENIKNEFKEFQNC